jgi:hypothetical protein
VSALVTGVLGAAFLDPGFWFYFFITAQAEPGQFLGQFYFKEY